MSYMIRIKDNRISRQILEWKLKETAGEAEKKYIASQI
jgi:hypothetical protein